MSITTFDPIPAVIDVPAGQAAAVTAAHTLAADLTATGRHVAEVRRVAFADSTAGFGFRFLVGGIAQYVRVPGVPLDLLRGPEATEPIVVSGGSVSWDDAVAQWNLT